MSANRKIEADYVSEAQYFAMLERSEARLEWIGGKIRAMAGGTSNHATLFGRLAMAINNRISADSTCEARTADIKVRAEASAANYLPDVVVYCDDAVWDETRPDWLLSPLLLAEVLSNSTEKIDENEKLLAYRQIPTLRHYLLLSQRRVLVKHHHRNDAGEWLLDLYNWRHQQIFLDVLNVTFPVEELYRRLDVPEGCILLPEPDEN